MDASSPTKQDLAAQGGPTTHEQPKESQRNRQQTGARQTALHNRREEEKSRPRGNLSFLEQGKERDRDIVVAPKSERDLKEPSLPEPARPARVHRLPSQERTMPPLGGNSRSTRYDGGYASNSSSASHFPGNYESDWDELSDYASRTPPRKTTPLHQQPYIPSAKTTQQYQQYYVPPTNTAQQSRQALIPSTNTTQRYQQDLEPDQSPRQTQPITAISVQVNPQNPQDITIQSELDATDDLEEELEEYSRLVRLGRFQAAQRQFNNHLMHFVDNPYVLDQYCSGILAMSDFHNLSQIGEKYALGPRPGIVQINTYMLLSRAGKLGGVSILSEKATQEPPDWLGCIKKIRERWPKLDATELKVILAGLCTKDGVENFRTKEIAEVYLHLRAGGRIWDFKDLLEQFLERTKRSVGETLELLLQYHDVDTERNLVKMIEMIEEDWGTCEADDVSSFALLEIFTTLALASMSQSMDITLVKAIFQIAKNHAQDILELKPSNSKSRPYLRWIVSKVLLEQYGDPNITGFFALARHLKNFPGSHFSPNVTLPLQGMIMYAPKENEAPEWQPDPSTTAGHDGALWTVLGAARELGDIELQATCLQLLIYHHPEPQSLLDLLCDLWHSVGKQMGYLETHLYRYIPKGSKTPEKRDSIRRQILLSGELSSGGTVSHTQYMVLRALTPRHHEKALYLERAREALPLTDHAPILQQDTEMPDVKTAGRPPPTRRFPMIPSYRRSITPTVSNEKSKKLLEPNAGMKRGSRESKEAHLQTGPSNEGKETTPPKSRPSNVALGKPDQEQEGRLRDRFILWDVKHKARQEKRDDADVTEKKPHDRSKGKDDKSQERSQVNERSI